MQVVTSVLYNTSGEFIKFPETEEEMSATAIQFAKYGFPNVISAIDGTHITIRPPSSNKADYCSRKHDFAINLTATCDANLVLTSVFAGYSAKVHDSRVFKASPLFEKMDTGILPPQYHIIGDAAYGLHQNLLTPYKDTGRGLTVAQAFYNNKHSQTRMAIERCFGMLKGRWLKLNYLDCEPSHWNKIILSCCVLHNICERRSQRLNTNSLPTLTITPSWTANEKRQQIMENFLRMNNGIAHS